MALPAKKLRTQSYLHQFTEALETGGLLDVRRQLDSLPPADVAHLIESSPPRMRDVIWDLIEVEREGEILQYLSDDLQVQFLSQMDAEEVVSVTEGLDADDIADVLQQLPDRVLRQVLDSMDAQDRHRLETVLSYPEDTAGGLMNPDAVTVRPRITLDAVLRYLRRHEALPDMTDAIIVVNRDDQFVGLLPVAKVLVSDPNLTVRDVMQTDIEPIPATMPAPEVAKLFERRDWVSAPVVNEAGRLLGRITIDDVVDVIIEQADHNVMSRAGLSEDADTFAPVWRAATKRAPWLGINLLTTFIAAGVIGLFADTIEQVVALAVLMPIIPSMGGVAGSQTLTLVIRGVALGHIGGANVRWLLGREVLVGLINGLFWAVAVALVATFWFNDPTLGVIAGAAMVFNLLAAPFAGAMLPIVLRAMRIDPALAGTVILTTVTDVVGFVAFLGLATWVY